MQLPALLISDLHLTASPDAEYRWGLFDWIHEQIDKHGLRTVICLGDLTDAKDNHPAELTNRIVREVDALRKRVIVIFIAGNHDWLKRGHEFFRFLNSLPNVAFITEPTEDPDERGPIAMYLPYSKDPVKEWAGRNFDMFDYLFMHQTVKGSVASNGQVMDGESLPPLNAAVVYSGDIHVPQKINGVIYVGSPYHVHFGDNFKPRCILLRKDREPLDLHFKTIKRVVVKVSSLEELGSWNLAQGDQVKLRVELAEADKHGWSKLRREAVAQLEVLGCSIHGIELTVRQGRKRVVVGDRPTHRAFSPPELVYRFSGAEELSPDAIDAALDILGE